MNKANLIVVGVFAIGSLLLTLRERALHRADVRQQHPVVRVDSTRIDSARVK